jgi:hypothetical protein
MKLLTVFLLVLLIFAFPQSHAQLKCEFVLDDIKTPWVWKPADNLLLGLRSNVHHFWEWSKNNESLLAPSLLAFQGWVLGDAHLFNFAEVKLKDGTYKWSFNDLDDSGIGPFVLDLMRFASTVVASNYKRVNFNDLFEAYTEGVSGKNHKKPSIVKDLRKLAEKEAENKWDEFIDKIIDAETEKLIYGVKGIVSFADGPQEMQKFILAHVGQFQKVLPMDTMITDMAFRTKELGGSQGLVRVFLSAKEGKDFVIYEFKPLVRPGLDYYQDQIAQEQRIEGIMKFLWEDSVPEDYRYIKIAGREFFMRVRLPKLFELHDEEEFLAMKGSDQREYLLYIANWMGKKHREQINNSEAYEAELKRPQTERQLEVFLENYLGVVQKLNLAKP